MHDLLLLVTIMLFGWLGSRVASRSLTITDVPLARALGIPIGITFVMFSANVFAQWLPLWVCLPIAVVLLLLAGQNFHSTAPWEEQEPFSLGHKWIIGLIIFCSVVNLHCTQLAGTSADFWMSYPLTRSFFQGNVPPVNPYFPDIALTGHYSHHLLIAVLSLCEQCDTIRTQWILELILIVNSVLLWVLAFRSALGKAQTSIFALIFVFLGVNVGSQVGLMDTFSHNDLLTYLLLAVIISLYTDIYKKFEARWTISPEQMLVTILITGTYGTICETHLVFVLLSFTVICLVLGYSKVSFRSRNQAVAIILSGSILLAVFQSNTNAIRRFFKDLHINREAFYITATTDRPEDIEAVPLQTPLPVAPDSSHSRATTSNVPFMVFPKKHFLAIRLGMDPYQRVSSALDTALFRRYKPVLDDGGYCSIFSPKLLVLHWFPLWLAPITIFWVIRKRNRAGIFFACFGTFAYFTPAIFDFGPVRESEYMRYEFAAGLTFAALLGIFVADLWHYSPRSKRLNTAVKTAIVIFILANLVGAQRSLNTIIIRLQKQPMYADRVVTLWYPPTDSWLLSLKELQLTKSDLALSQWLWDNAGESRRMLTFWYQSQEKSTAKLIPGLDINPQTATVPTSITVSEPTLLGQEQDIINQVGWEAVISGGAGTMPLGHAVPPQWMTRTNAPFIPSSPALVFAATSQPEALAGLNVNWVVAPRPLKNSASPNASLLLVKTIKEDNIVRYLYEVRYSDRQLSSSIEQKLTTDNVKTLKIKVSGIPAHGSGEAGVPYPLDIEFNRPVKGWLKPSIRNLNNEKISCLSPLTSWVEGTRTRAWITFPLVEGDYWLNWQIAPSQPSHPEGFIPLPGEQRIAYSLSTAIEECLRVERITQLGSNWGELVLKNTSGQTFQTRGPLRIQWWVWDPRTHNYSKPSLYEGEAILSGAFLPHQSVTIKWLVKDRIPENCRLDITASSIFGPSIAIPRLFNEQ